MESLSQLLIPVFSEGASLLILWSWQAFLLLGLVWQHPGWHPMIATWLQRSDDPVVEVRCSVTG